MSRPLRLEFKGPLYYIASRGNTRKTIYLEEADFELFLTVLDAVCLQCNWVIHSYFLELCRYIMLNLLAGSHGRYVGGMIVEPLAFYGKQAPKLVGLRCCFVLILLKLRCRYLHAKLVAEMLVKTFWIRCNHQIFYVMRPLLSNIN
ncbi:hypothetical protein [Shewanella sp. DW31]|uniref:hypothetical protein n=1 Tax=Shewanella TaxID=22 RepID=UPI0018E394FF|nr:hypothetical protein [Shewanella sp. DW31]MBI1674384.1 hypothetical protein [Shewanella sp. DW31]